MTQKENTFLRGKREHNNTEKVKKQNNLFYEIKQRHKKRGLAGLKSEINFSAYCHKKNLNKRHSAVWLSFKKLFILHSFEYRYC